MARRPKCFGSPGIDAVCASCGLRVDCFDEFNDGSDWNLLVRAPTLNLLDDEDIDPLSADAIGLRAKNVTLSGAKALLRAAESVHQHTGIPLDVVKSKSGVVTWRWRVRQKRGRTIFAEVKKATARCLKMELKTESKLLRSFVKPPKTGKLVLLQGDPEIEDDLLELVYHLSIALRDLTVKTRSL